MLLVRNGHTVWLWDHDGARMHALAKDRVDPLFLPGVVLPESINPTDCMENALAATNEVLVVVPSHAFRATIDACALLRPAKLRLAWATKGLEPVTERPFSVVVDEVLGADTPTAVLSGPTFASEVLAGQPTAITIASRFADYAQWLAGCLRNANFRPYTSDDVLGVQIGGAVKNVMAIAVGISDGLGFGANARAALITRGLAEIIRLGVVLGGRPETFMGLTGVGDLVLTCTDDLSRNRRFGLAIGRGEKADAALKTIGQVVEGLTTVQEVMSLARRLGVEMPITNQVYAVLYEGHDPHTAVQTLLTRALRAE